jgi:hypothetical protein
MKNVFVRGILSLAAAAGLAACGGGNTNPNNGGGGGGPTCALPSTFAVVYPINGASNVPPSNSYVYIATQSNIGGGNFNAAVQPPNGLPAYVGSSFAQIALSSIPKPRSLPTFSGAIYYRSFISAYASGGLITNSTYQVGYNNQGTSCSPNLFDTFTTAN